MLTPTEVARLAELRKLLQSISQLADQHGGMLPYFNFYPQDFLFGTRFFTREERSLYLELLCHEWVAGSLPGNVEQLAGVVRMKPEKFTRLWAGKLGTKFLLCDGSYYNVRLERERKQALGGGKRKRGTSEPAF